MTSQHNPPDLAGMREILRAAAVVHCFRYAAASRGSTARYAAAAFLAADWWITRGAIHTGLDCIDEAYAALERGGYTAALHAEGEPHDKHS
jgi:hypothetical protein